MLNIKNCCFGLPKTFKSILNYDKHNYKKLDDIVLNDNEPNVQLINNVAEFEQDLKKYKADLFKSYRAERHKKLKKSDKEIRQIFNDSNIMRTFRISVNHIELDSLHSYNDSDQQRRKNIIDFYKNIVDTFELFLNENNKFTKNVKIIKADIHFDQTTPHLHIHVSNLYEKELKKLNRKDFMTCNCKITDLIRLLKQSNEFKINKILTINELFTNLLKKNIKDNNYHLINKIDLKKLWPEIYDVNKIANINNIDLKNSNISRMDKKIFFLNAINFLKKINFKPEANNILNCRKLDIATLYLFKQLQYIKLIENDFLIKKNEILESFWKNDEKNLIDDLIKIKQKYNICLSEESLKLNEDKLCSLIQNYVPKLKNFEDELKNNLGLFIKKELDILKNQYIIKQKEEEIKWKINKDFELNNKRDKLEILNNEILIQKQNLKMKNEKLFFKQNKKTINNDLNKKEQNLVKTQEINDLVQNQNNDLINDFKPENNLNFENNNCNDLKATSFLNHCSQELMNDNSFVETIKFIEKIQKEEKELLIENNIDDNNLKISESMFQTENSKQNIDNVLDNKISPTINKEFLLDEEYDHIYFSNQKHLNKTINSNLESNTDINKIKKIINEKSIKKNKERTM